MLNILLLLAVTSLLATQEPVRVGGDDPTPKRIKTVQPVYPEPARNAWLEGIVILDVVVDENGDVADVKVIRAIPFLEEAAVAAVRQWKYEPPVVDGQAASVVFTVPMRFQIPGGDEWTVVPEGEPELRLERYNIRLSREGVRTYDGAVKNVSDDSLSDVWAVVFYREDVDTAEETVDDTAEFLSQSVELGALPPEESRVFTLTVEPPADGELVEAELVFVKGNGDGFEVLSTERQLRTINPRSN